MKSKKSETPEGLIKADLEAMATDAGDAAYFSVMSYEDVLLAFKRRGSSFEAWCRRSGFDDRKARHAVRIAQRENPEYRKIRKSLRDAITEMGGRL